MRPPSICSYLRDMISSLFVQRQRHRQILFERTVHRFASQRLVCATSNVGRRIYLTAPLCRQMLKESTSKLNEELKACKRERQQMLVKKIASERKREPRVAVGRVSPSQEETNLLPREDEHAFEDAHELKQLLRDRRPSHVDAEGRECKHLGFWRRDQISRRLSESDKKMVRQLLNSPSG